MNEREFRDGFLEYVKQRIKAKQGLTQGLIPVSSPKPEATDEPLGIHAAYRPEKPKGPQFTSLPAPDPDTQGFGGPDS